MSEQVVSELSLEQKVGQLFMAGFDGTTPTDEIRDLVREYNLGSVIYFSRNVETPDQLADLSATLQAAATERGAGEPLIVATDQEGGVVSRLDWGTELPGQMMLGACGDERLARRAGEAVGAELKSLGVNMNLAPVLDVNNNPDNPVIGVRSFGEQPHEVGALGSAVAAGMQSAGVIACGKHFPGHGDTATDSHLAIPVVDHDRARLERVEFAPFRRAIEDGIDAVMTTHVSFPTITGDDSLPATLSPAVQTGLLREEFGFDGLIVTDCLEMNAIADSVGTPEGAVQAIEAGCDVPMVSHTPETQRAAIEAVVEAVREGRIAEERIDESLARVRAYKEQRDLKSADPSSDRWGEAADRSRSVARQVADCGVTLVRDEADLLPFDISQPIHTIGFTGERGSSAEDARYHPSLVSDALSAAGAKLVSTDVSDPESYDPSFDGGEQVLVYSYDARSNDDQAAFVRSLCGESVDVAVLAVRNPYDLSKFPAVGTYLTTYDYSPASLAAASKVIVGDLTPTGELPVTIPDA